MRNLSRAVIALMAMAATPALAADMAVKAPPPPSPATNWSGFYVGLNAGAGIATGEFLDSAFTVDDAQINDPTFTAGGQLGYNWQRGALVYGLEGDFNWISANKTDPYAVPASGACTVATCTATLKMDSFGSIRGRLGLAYDSALFYITAGPAFGHFNSAVHWVTGVPVAITSPDNVWLPGVAVGAGVEYMLSNNLSIRAEFLYLLFDQSNANYFVNATGAPIACGNPTCGINFTYTAALARLGLDWKIGTDPSSYSGAGRTSTPSALVLKAPRLEAATGWSGPYAGLNVGGGLVTGEFLDSGPAFAETKINDPFFTAGGQLGYNWQKGALVYGIEGDFDWISANESQPFAQNHGGCAGDCSAALKMDAFGSIRGRMGLAYDSALVYVTAGPAVGHFNSAVVLNSPPLVTSTDKVWLPGVAAGAGVEYMLSNTVSVRGEILYLLFKDSNVNYVSSASGLPFICASGVPCGINYTYSAAIARLGLNWKLGADPGGPIYKAPLTSPADWSGLYAGLNGGGGIVAGKALNNGLSGAEIEINDPSFTGGGQLGYNWQRGALVYGLEGDINWVSANKSLPYAQGDAGCTPASCTATLKMDAYGSIRGRMGLAYDSTLLYVTAGPAVGHFNSAVNFNGFGVAASTSTDNVWRPGVVVGAGLEYMLTKSLSVRGELLYLLFEDSNESYIVNATGAPLICGGGGPCVINYTYSAEIARLGLDWKLN